MSKVLGKNSVVFINDAGVWKLYACGTSVTLDLTTDFVETSVSGQGNFATYMPSKDSFTGTLEGITSLEEFGKLSLPDLRQRQIAHELLLMRFQRTDNDGHVYTDEGHFFISRSSDVGSFDDVSKFTIELRGTGSLTQVFTPIAPVPLDGILAQRFEFTGTEGQSEFTFDGTGGTDDLRNKTILEVNSDGLGNGKIITSGTPVGKEVKYTASTGVFTYAIPFEDGEEGYILYQDIP